MKAKKRKLTFFDKLILWINYGFVAALLISYLAPITDPRSYWVIAFFGLAYPILLLGNVILIVYWALRQKLYFLLSFFCILVNLNLLNKNWGFHSDGEVKGGSMRMM